MFSKIRAYVSSNPLVHVGIAAFIGAVLPIALPAVQSGNISIPVAKVAISAGIAAVIRAIVLAVPAKTTPAA